MRSLTLQDWLTLRGPSTLTTFIQSASDYLDMSAFEDYVAWVEIRELTYTGTGTPQLVLETAPIQEDEFFAATGLPSAQQTYVPLALGVTTAKNILNVPNPTNQIPLARWLRWRLSMPSPTSTWSLTFRVKLAAHSYCLPLQA